MWFFLKGTLTEIVINPELFACFEPVQLNGSLVLRVDNFIDLHVNAALLVEDCCIDRVQSALFVKAAIFVN